MPVAFYDSGLSDFLRQARPGLLKALDVPAHFGQAYATVLVAFALGAAGRRQTGVRMIAALLIVLGVVWALKAPIHRLSPNSESFSFPSGNAAVAAVLLAPLMARAFWLAPVGLVLIATVVAQRLVGGYHWPSDTLVGCAIGLLAYISTDMILPKRFRGLRRRWWVLTGLLVWGLMLFGLLGSEEQTHTIATVFGPALALYVAGKWIRLAARRGRVLRWPEVLRPRRPGVILGILLLCTLAGYLTLASQCTFWDRDEARYARATHEMADTGMLLVPTFNFEWRLHQPVGIYWMMMPGQAALDGAELGYRLPSILGAILAGTLVFRIGKWFFGARTGLWAAAALVTCPLLLITGTLAVTEAMLLATILLCLSGFVDDLHLGPHPWRSFGVGLALGMGMLLKGPVAPAVVAMCIGGTWLLLRKNFPLPRRYGLYVLGSFLLAVAFFACWAVPTLLATRGQLWTEGFMNHVVQWSLEPREGLGGSFLLYLPFYIGVLLAGLFPWTFLLPGAIPAVVSGRVVDRLPRAFLLALFVPVFLVFSLIATKLPHYILPAVPAVVLAIGAVLVNRDRLSPRDVRLIRVGHVIVVALAFLGGAALLVAPVLVTASARKAGLGIDHNLNRGTAAIAAVLFVLPLALRRWPRAQGGDLVSRAGICVAYTVLFCAALVSVTLPAIEQFKPARRIAHAVHEKADRAVPVYLSGYDEPSLFAYIHRGPMENVPWQDIETWADSEDRGVLIITLREYRRFLNSGQEAPNLQPITPVYTGLNYNRGEWYQLIALGRNLR